MMEAMAIPTYVQRAEALAREAHANDLDKHKQPYVGHLERVVAGVLSEGHGPEVVAVAWLHDLLEDHPEYHEGDLLALGLPVPVVAAIEILTRREGQTYAQYIANVKASGNALALAVKRADLVDHFRPGMPAELRPRYLKAWAVLVGGGPPPLLGTWPESSRQRAFVAGAAWWQFAKNGSTMFGSERAQAEDEAVRRYGDPLVPTPQ